jgi:hypothetical protein
MSAFTITPESSVILRSGGLGKLEVEFDEIPQFFHSPLRVGRLYDDIVKLLQQEGRNPRKTSVTVHWEENWFQGKAEMDMTSWETFWVTFQSVNYCEEFSIIYRWKLYDSSDDESEDDDEEDMLIE